MVFPTEGMSTRGRFNDRAHVKQPTVCSGGDAAIPHGSLLSAWGTQRLNDGCSRACSQCAAGVMFMFYMSEKGPFTLVSTPNLSIFSRSFRKENTYLIWHSEYPDSHLLSRRVCSSWTLDLITKLRMKKFPLSLLFLGAKNRNNQTRATAALPLHVFTRGDEIGKSMSRVVQLDRVSMVDPRAQINMHNCTLYQKIFASGVQGPCAEGEPDFGDRLTASAALQLWEQQSVHKVGVGKTQPGAHPTVKREDLNVGYSDRCKLVKTPTRCDFVVRDPQISLGNIYEKCQGEAGGWRAPLPSSTWLFTPNSSLTSLACERVCLCMCEWSCECVCASEGQCLARG